MRVITLEDHFLDPAVATATGNPNPLAEGSSALEPHDAIPLARGANDTLARAVAEHPDRFAGNDDGRRLLDAAPLSPADTEKFTHANAERVLGLSPVDAGSQATV
jgi:predicted TIM-barrel fold metal-dependent hydrolase